MANQASIMGAGGQESAFAETMKAGKKKSKQAAKVKIAEDAEASYSATGKK